MDDSTTRLALGLIGVIGLTCLIGIVVLQIMGRDPSPTLTTIAAACAGSVSTFITIGKRPNHP